jgi:nitrate reductase alpha subunit
VLNPLAHYPNRGWEQLYRNQYAYDRQFSWVCAPNDTHNCRITAHVRNGVIVRLGEQYDVHTYTDLYGKHASAAGATGIARRATPSTASSTGRTA